MPRPPDTIGDATLRLLLGAGIGPATRRRLRERLGSDEAVVTARVAALEGVPGIGSATARTLRAAMAEVDPAGERAAMRAAGVGLVLGGDPDYPPLLAPLPAAPDALWVRGAWTGDDRLAVAIVGARRASAYGGEQASRFGALLGEAGLAIVSGGAVGIDAAAHRGALRAGARTIAVLGCGLGVCYPARHRLLFDAIVDGGGALVSEFPMLAPPLAANFPRRNRIISGLALGVLVVEAARRSGALVTARIAAEDHGREVMALPGRVDSASAAGCHALIRDGGAALVVDAADVLRQLDGCGRALRALVAAGDDRPGLAGADGSLFDGVLTEGQRAIVERLAAAGEPLPLATLLEQCGRAPGAVLADLTLLELRGRVRRTGGGLALTRGVAAGRASASSR